MDLQINSKSRVPVHVQLEEQIKHLILTERFAVGSRLPSIRAMAGFLRVNRNTVARVMSDLEREGYVESRRGSGVYVVEPPVDAEDLERREVVERVLDLAAAQGISVEELASALLARAGAEPSGKASILFVECTPAELNQFSDELEAQLPVEVERVLLEDLAERVSGDDIPSWRLAVTTFFHVHEVQEIVEPLGMETVALLADATLESLRRLTELPAGTPVGVVGWGRTCMENLSRSIEGAGLDHLRFTEVRIEEEERMRELFGEVRAMVCSTVTARRLREIMASEAVDWRKRSAFGRSTSRRLEEPGAPGPAEPEIIEEDRTLDKGGVEMLGRMLRRLPRTEPQESQT
ncbi:MAG: GntR family transcriptional regulator [Actinomycetota bacterium]|jgi:DNA-binding transcriptional regulator YhcF (GntR family)|nr:GntR family transcriptional regulator [Rubrobacter sp.]MDQ3567795.1 GntR family transcriptional regulator [Actinomycetota bacterium]